MAVGKHFLMLNKYFGLFILLESLNEINKVDLHRVRTFVGLVEVTLRGFFRVLEFKVRRELDLNSFRKKRVVID